MSGVAQLHVVSDDVWAPPRWEGIEETVKGDTGDDSGLLVATMHLLAVELGVDGLAVGLHRRAASELVFVAGECQTSKTAREAALKSACDLVAGSHGMAVTQSTRCPTLNADLLTAVVPVSGVVYTLTALLREDLEIAIAQCGDRLACFVPLLTALFDQAEQAGKTSSRMSGLTAAVNNSAVATFLVSRAAEVLFVNCAGSRLLAQGEGIRRSGSRIGCCSLSETLRLHAAIEHVCATGNTDADMAPVLILRRNRRRPLMVAVRSSGQDQQHHHGTAAVVYAFDPEQDVTAGMAPVCRFYGLSPNEAKLTCRLAQGASLAEAADSIGVRQQTARSYLKQIFLKTETNRQAELVWLVLKSAVQTRLGSRIQVFE